MSNVETGSGVITIYYNDFCFVDWSKICKAFGVYPHGTKSLQIHARQVVKISSEQLDEEDELIEYSEDVQQKYVDHFKNMIKENTAD